MQTFAGKAFEIDLDEDWRFFPEPGENPLLYFQNQRVDAALACDSMVLEPHDSDLNEVGGRFVEAYVGALGKAAAMEGAPEPPKILSVDLTQDEFGPQWIVTGFSLGRGKWIAWVVFRSFMYFTMRIESLTLPETQLRNLFDETRRQVFLAVPVSHGLPD